MFAFQRRLHRNRKSLIRKGDPVVLRTGPIRNFTPSKVTVVACVLAADTLIPMHHDVTFSVVQLDREPVTLHSESRTVASGQMNAFEVTLAQSVRHWEVRIDADPDLVFITIYHLIDGRSEPNMTYHTSDLYYVDLIDEFDGDPGMADILNDQANSFDGKLELPSDWLDGDDGEEQQLWW